LARIPKVIVLRRNVLLSFAGQVLPLAAAIPCIPILLEHAGVERFGLLTMVWALLGYSTLLDLGLSRALTQLVAGKAGRGEERDIPALAWTAFLFLGGVGLLGGVAVALLARPVVGAWLKLGGGLGAEALRSAYLIAASFPLLLVTMAFRGILEGRQRFDLITAVRLPMGVATYAAPLAVLPFTARLEGLVAVLLATRILTFLFLGLFAFRVVPDLRRGAAFRASELPALLSFGGWASITTLMGAVIAGLDRFVIGAVRGVASVAYYTTPFEMITKLWLIPWSIGAAVFPEFARRFPGDPASASTLLLRSMKYNAALTFPAVLLLFAFAEEGLALWLGAEFAGHGAGILRWLALAMVFSTQEQLLLAYLQGIGRPDSAAKLHAVLIAVYLGVLILFLRTFGIEGAAMAWALHCFVDFLGMSAIAVRLGRFQASALRRAVPGFAAMIALPAAFLLPMSLGGKIAAAALLLLAFAGFCFAVILEEPDRRKIGAMLGLGTKDPAP
jgi:O-antigen/teichoic acid export membrane protein